MDEDHQHDDEPHDHHDLPQLEQPGPRADPLFERQTDDTELVCHGFRARLHSDTPVRSPTGTATALTRLVLAAGLPAAAVIAGGRALGITGELIVTLALVVFILTGGVGLFLILRIERSARETHSREESNKDRATGRQRVDHRSRHGWRPVHKLNLIRFRRTARPRGRR